MKESSTFYPVVSIVVLLTLLLSLSSAPPLLARQEPLPSLEERSVSSTEDTTAPAAITNLVAVAGTSPGSVELSWVAPGDDATTGTAHTYIIRYNRTIITDDNWDTSTDLSDEPAPSEAGSVESMMVTGLAPGGMYYFAIKTQDEVPNTSSISNSPRAAISTSNATYLPLALSSFSHVPTVIPETTEVLTQTTTQYLSGVSESGAIFTFTQSTPSLDALAPGDVMVSGPTNQAPYGFLREVISVSTADGQVVVVSEAATLEDAIQSGEAHVSRVLTPANIQRATQLQGVTLAPTQLLDQFCLTLDDVVLFDGDGDRETTNDQVTASGSIELEPSFDFDIVVRDWVLEELSFTASAVETADLKIQSKLEIFSFQEEREIAQYTFAPITVLIPPSPFPIVFVPVLTVYVGADGSAHVGVTARVEQQATLVAGLRYAGGVWQPVSSFSNDFNYTPPTLSAGLQVKGYAGAQISLMLYGVVGPHAKLQAYLELEADTIDDPWWTLWGGLEVPLGIEVEVLGHTIVETETVAIGYRIALAHATSNAPPHMPFSPFPADGAIVQDLETNLSWSGGDQDGDSVTYDVYLEADDSTPDVLVSNDQTGLAYDPGTLLPNTHYFWRIIAIDEHRAMTVGPVWEFTTATGDTCPINLTLQPPQVEDLDVTVSGTVTSTCSTITHLNWQWGDGRSDNQWFPARHSYAVTGTYPMTVTAYNNLGDTEVVTMTAYVGTLAGPVVIIPAGEFQMGCDSSNPNEYCSDDEQPLHTVYLDTYIIGTYEVTNTQYAEFLNEMGNQEEGGTTWLDINNSSVHIHEIGGVWQVDAGYEDHPVIAVTWYGARAYCQWLGLRLPTEAEWEKAARGSSDTRMYPWGNDDPDCSLLNYFHYDGSTYEYCVTDTTPVGSYPGGASPYGVLDMSGNVAEWVNDRYASDYYSSSPYSNPQGPENGSLRVTRGASWGANWEHVRTASRSHYNPYNNSHVIGFRCAGDVPGQ